MNMYWLDALPVPGAQRDDLEVMSRFHLACLNHGLLIAGRGMAVTCTVMDEQTIDDAVGRTTGAMTDLAATLREESGL